MIDSYIFRAWNCVPKLLCCLVLLAAPQFAAPASAADVCTCPQPPELEKALEKSSIVFVGRVLEQRPTPFKKGYTEAKISVFRKFKGFEELPKSEYVLTYTPESDANCKFAFQNGYEYLIFAEGPPAFFTVTKCSRTQLLDNAQLDQQRLIRMTQAK